MNFYKHLVVLVIFITIRLVYFLPMYVVYICLDPIKKLLDKISDLEHIIVGDIKLLQESQIYFKRRNNIMKKLNKRKLSKYNT